MVNDQWGVYEQTNSQVSVSRKERSETNGHAEERGNEELSMKVVVCPAKPALGGSDH
jgi:hypothetical protein